MQHQPDNHTGQTGSSNVVPLRAVPPIVALTGDDILREICAVLASCVPKLSPDDPAYSRLYALRHAPGMRPYMPRSVRGAS